MKKTDIAMIIFIAGISILLAYVIVNSMVSGLKNEPVKVPTAKAISTEVPEPDKTIFNSGAINPTISTNIGDTSNQ